MKKNLFQSGVFNEPELLEVGMGADYIPISALLESAKEPKTPPLADPKPAVIPQVEPKPEILPKPELLTESAKDQAFFEAVSAKVDQDDRGMAAASIIDWATNGDKTAAGLDMLAAALAGIDTDSDADITDADVDNYNYWLGLLANAAVALGADQDDVTAAIDDDDDDAASVVADAITVGDNESEAIAQHQFMSESVAMFEASKKVVHAGKVVLIKKRPRPRRQTAAQRNALKKNRLKAHTAAAQLSRLKSMRLRRSKGL